MSKGFVRLLLAVAAYSSTVHPAVALDPNTTDPHVIMRAASDPAGSERSWMRVKMTTREASSQRERIFSMRSLRFDAGHKSLILIEKPSDVRNTGVLTISYDTHAKPDEQWLYLPALHRVSRVPSSSKSDSFVGSDFSISDLTRQNPDDYDMTLVDGAAKVAGEDCWQIESVPRRDKVKQETGYSKTQTWVSKAKGIPVQMKLWGVDGSKIKYFKASDIRQRDGAWTPHRLQMRTLQAGSLVSETLMEVLSITVNAADVRDADFTQERLEGGV